jgi:hypothetical protein
MQSFIVSLVGGWAFPLLPLIAEFGVSGRVQPEAWAVTGVVYAAAVGLSSRNQAITISALFCSALCAVVYGAGKLAHAGTEYAPFIRYGSFISAIIVLTYMLAYAFERFARHVVEAQPFLEIDP